MEDLFYVETISFQFFHFFDVIRVLCAVSNYYFDPTRLSLTDFWLQYSLIFLKP